MTRKQPMIELQNVSKTYIRKRGAPVQAVHDVTLNVELGEFLVITGRSGSGKTTLLNLAAGLAQPTEGQVLFEGSQAWMQPDAQRARLRNERVGFIFQFPSLMPSLTALENVLLPTIFGTYPNPEATRARALAGLEQVGLADRTDAYPRQLSGGEQQRVVIARSLINQPDLLLADEPTSDLDEHTEHEIMDILRGIHRNTGVTIMLVTHASDLVLYGTRGVHMAEGHIVPSGVPSAPNAVHTAWPPG